MSSQLQPLPLFTASICALIQLDRAQSTPLYQQICEKLREAIHSGQLAEGTRLPTERALAKELGVNRTTVMNAYNQLASEGLLEGHVGRGTLVRHNSFSYVDDSFDTDGPSWLFGLPAGEREPRRGGAGRSLRVPLRGGPTQPDEGDRGAAGAPRDCVRAGW